jgi:hypothetical protein
MDYYTVETLDEFIRKTVCLGDSVLYKYYQEVNRNKFRARLSRLTTNDFDYMTSVYTFVTNVLRDYIYEIIGKLTLHMKPFGEVILTGGEAFNSYFGVEDKIITSDIDTKFVPTFYYAGKKIDVKDPRFFTYLQACKVYIWDFLGEQAVELSKKVAARIELLKQTIIGKLLNITLDPKYKPITRRYILINKTKQSPENKTNIIEKDILIDVEVFALDLHLRYYSCKTKKIESFSIGGVLDIPFMRPHEIGYDVIYSHQKGVDYKDLNTNKLIHNPNILVANKRFLVEDIYIMQLLGLRPHKIEKDRTRMFLFCKKILKIDGITNKTSIHTLFKKALPKIQKEKKPKLHVKNITKTIMNKIHLINPNKYVAYTTTPNQIRTILQFILPGSSTKLGATYQPTQSKYMFNTTSKKWKISKNPHYVKNIYNYRPTKYIIPKKPVPVVNTLYSLNKARNIYNNLVIRKSAMIPLIGLKNSSAFIIK